MNKTIAAATVAASLAAGGLVGTVIGTPSIAGAAVTAAGAVSWVQDALSGLVEAGTITQEQSDAVATALADARPEPGPGRHGRVHLDLSGVAEALGMTAEELHTALEGDQTLAAIAADRGVDVADVVDAILAAQREQLAAEVSAGELTQAQADEILAGAEERATALVNGEMPAFAGGHHRGRGWMSHGERGPGEGEGS
jgi:hypothetical protein